MTDEAVEVNVPETKLFVLPNKLYDVFRYLSLVLLPAVSTLYFTLSSLWGLPSTEQVIGSIAAIEIFIGVLLKISSVGYKKAGLEYGGKIIISKSDNGNKVYSLELNTSPDSLDTLKLVTFKIEPNNT